MPLPHYPGPRLAYDQDGTVGFIPITSQRHPDKGTLLELPSDALRVLNDDYGHTLAIKDEDAESGASPRAYWDFPNGAPSPNFLSLVFPTPRRIAGWMCSTQALTTGSTNGQGWVPVDALLSVSHDTTNGADGTWRLVSILRSDEPQVSQIRSVTDPEWYVPYYGLFISGTVTQAGLFDPDLNRYADEASVGLGWRALYGAALRNVAGVRLDFPDLPALQGSILWLTLHLYGEPDTLATQHRVVFEDATGQEFSTIASLGDLGLMEEATEVIRIRNLSDTLTATEVTVSSEAHMPVEFSLDGIDWSPSVDLPSIPPGDHVEVHVKVSPPDGMVGFQITKLQALVEWD